MGDCCSKSPTTQYEGAHTVELFKEIEETTDKGTLSDGGEHTSDSQKKKFIKGRGSEKENGLEEIMEKQESSRLYNTAMEGEPIKEPDPFTIEPSNYKEKESSRDRKKKKKKKKRKEGEEAEGEDGILNEEEEKKLKEERRDRKKQRKKEKEKKRLQEEQEEQERIAELERERIAREKEEEEKLVKEEELRKQREKEIEDDENKDTRRKKKKKKHKQHKGRKDEEEEEEDKGEREREKEKDGEMEMGMEEAKESDRKKKKKHKSKHRHDHQDQHDQHDQQRGEQEPIPQTRIKPFDHSQFPYTLNNPQIIQIIKRFLTAFNGDPLQSQIAQLPQREKQLIGLLEADFESVNGIIENPAWQQSLKKANCVGYSMKDSGGKTIAKSIGNIPFTPIEVMAYIDNLDWKKDFDELFREGFVVEQLPLNGKITNQRFNGKMMTKGRDFCLINQTRLEQSSGKITAYYKSFEDERVPPNKAFVRGVVNKAIYELHPTETNTTYAVYIFQFDPMGSIPAALKSKVVKKHSGKIQDIADAMKKRFGNK